MKSAEPGEVPGKRGSTKQWVIQHTADVRHSIVVELDDHAAGEQNCAKIVNVVGVEKSESKGAQVAALRQIQGVTNNQIIGIQIPEAACRRRGLEVIINTNLSLCGQG